jgi:hypothetical protein
MAERNLPEKITADLEQSGFGSELAALRIFHRAPFRTTAGLVYFDNVVNTKREIDVSAEYEVTTTTANHWLCQAAIVVRAEVKKTKQPWVVLQSGTYENPYNVYLDESLMRLINVNVRSEYTLNEVLARYHQQAGDSWFGHGVHEAFKKPDELGRWFTSASKVSRACWSLYGELKHSQANLASLFLLQPLVIIDGLLFKAAANDDFSVSLQQIDKATVLYYERTSDFSRRFLVDIVTLKHLDIYVNRLKGTIQIMHDELARKLEVASAPASQN